MPAAYLIASLPGDNLSWIGVGFGCCPLGFGGSPHLWQGMSEVSHRVTSLGRASSPPRTHMLNPGYDISSRQRKLQLPRRKFVIFWCSSLERGRWRRPLRCCHCYGGSDKGGAGGGAVRGGGWGCGGGERGVPPRTTWLDRHSPPRERPSHFWHHMVCQSPNPATSTLHRQPPLPPRPRPRPHPARSTPDHPVCSRQDATAAVSALPPHSSR